jgi:hypothetical protein
VIYAEFQDEVIQAMQGLGTGVSSRGMNRIIPPATYSWVRRPGITPAGDPSGTAPDMGYLVQLEEEAGVCGERYIHSRRFLIGIDVSKGPAPFTVWFTYPGSSGPGYAWDFRDVGDTP